jgi:hypothetical protein
MMAPALLLTAALIAPHLLTMAAFLTASLLAIVAFIASPLLAIAVAIVSPLLAMAAFLISSVSVSLSTLAAFYIAAKALALTSSAAAIIGATLAAPTAVGLFVWAGRRLWDAISSMAKHAFQQTNPQELTQSSCASTPSTTIIEMSILGRSIDNSASFDDDTTNENPDFKDIGHI